MQSAAFLSAHSQPNRLPITVAEEITVRAVSRPARRRNRRRKP